MKYKFSIAIVFSVFILLLGFVFVNKVVDAATRCTQDPSYCIQVHWSPMPSWNNNVNGYDSTATYRYIDVDAGINYTSSGTCHTPGINGGSCGMSLLDQDGGHYAVYSPYNKFDDTSPTCGSWDSSSAPVYTLSGSTDALSGINTAGGTCSAPASGGTCNVLISDIAGNTRYCTSPTYTPPVTKIDGSCSTTTRFGCNSGTSINNLTTTTAYTWTCAGSGVGIDRNCSELIPGGGGSTTWIAPTCPTACGTAASTMSYTCSGTSCSPSSKPADVSCPQTAKCPIGGGTTCTSGFHLGADGVTCVADTYSCQMTAYLGVAGSGSYCADNATGPSSAWHIVSSCSGAICGVVCNAGYSPSGGQCVDAGTPTTNPAACGAVHYSCFSGFSSGSTGDTTTAYNWNCVSDTVKTCSEPKQPLQLPHATISATSCTIASGASTCNSSVTWSTDYSMLDYVPSIEVTRNNPDYTHVSYNDTGYQVSNAINYGTSSYFVYINATEFASATVSATCASNTSWNGSACAVLGEGSLPDLTAGVVTPTTVATGMANTFSTTISNTGTVSTGASFPYFFQVASSAGGSGTITDLASSTMTTLIASASNTATKSYTFSSAGTYSMRVCADKTSAAGGGVIAESNENNNCGAWANITATDSSVDGASCSSFTTSASVNKGASFPVTIVIKNTGNTTWDTAAPYGLTLVPWPQSTWTGSTWNSLPSSTIAPGASATFNFNVTAPSTSGNYNFNWQMLHNGVAWFGQQCLKSVVVVDPSAPGTGMCGITHYACNSGTSASNISTSSKWTWVCKGANNGPSASCSESKKKPVPVEN